MSGSVGSATSTASTTSSAGSSASKLTGDFNTFLTLLTTQLQNQDPTNAMDPNEMTQQLVQFSSVEQQIRTNSQLESLIRLQQGNQLVSAAPLMGRTVEVQSSQLALQNGVATLRLPAAGDANAAQIVITDGAGRLVRSGTVALGAERSDFQWDGTSSSGTRVADGAYNVTVTGIAADGTTASLPFTVLGTATGVDRTDSAVRLSLGKLSVDFDRLRSVGGS
ncbi:flagellar hook assembly protein FlgD [Roseococcus sp. YIM B11640]|uniref:flagellar hook assembly protein FlgD n=1 Tax=Roseococcus sp. YIM B11640 TaxID=3133973 RepID=UPI003C7E5160